ncbi:MAG: WhiB family transcriptional regulator [Streptosporangiaceae bacterium]
MPPTEARRTDPQEPLDARPGYACTCHQTGPDSGLPGRPPRPNRSRDLRRRRCPAAERVGSGVGVPALAGHGTQGPGRSHPRVPSAARPPGEPVAPGSARHATAADLTSLAWGHSALPGPEPGAPAPLAGATARPGRARRSRRPGLAGWARVLGRRSRLVLPLPGESAEPAKAICAACAVRADCLALARARGSDSGSVACHDQQRLSA